MNKLFRALSNEKRRRVLGWLRDPESHFPPQKDGDLVKDGVCVVFIAEKLKVSQPTATEHMKILHEAMLVIPKHVKQWTFYRRNEAAIQKARSTIAEHL